MIVRQNHSDRVNSLRGEHIFGLPAVAVAFGAHDHASIVMQLDQVYDATKFLSDFDSPKAAYLWIVGSSRRHCLVPSGEEPFVVDMLNNMGLNELPFRLFDF